ncbi:MAG: 2'-5' RNA ligase family protein [Chitinophagaceae bacterium]
MSTRRQLTLFIPEPHNKMIEQVRMNFNPIQYSLIKSHVTLCRDDELELLDQVLNNLLHLKQPAITIQFNPVRRSANGKGALLPAADEQDSFHQLRKSVLAGINDLPILPQPHITLMHPRNSTCTDELFEQIQKYEFPSQITFTEIAFIEKVNDGIWTTLQTFQLQ